MCDKIGKKEKENVHDECASRAHTSHKNRNA